MTLTTRKPCSADCDRTTIATMHTYARPAGSTTEARFIRRYIAPIKGSVRDAFGNWHVRIGPDTCPILFSSHTDTVARSHGRQRVILDRNGMLSLDPADKARGCLGADDTAGVWIMLELIRAGIPGHYIFHYAEERGAIGSGDLARNDPALLGNAQIAIAFDRAGTGDVITYQFGDRSASDAFAWSMADALSAVDPLLSYAPADGVFTDTASYVDVIPECTNLSVGYEHAHSYRETLDTGHLIALRNAMIALDYDSLVVARNPLESAFITIDDADLSWDDINGITDPFDSLSDRLYWDRVLSRKDR